MSDLIPRNQFKVYKNNLKAVYRSSLIPYFDKMLFSAKEVRQFVDVKATARIFSFLIFFLQIVSNFVHIWSW